MVGACNVNRPSGGWDLINCHFDSKRGAANTCAAQPRDGTAHVGTLDLTYLISRCRVIRLRNLLYFFSSSRPDVFFRFCAPANQA